MPWGGTVLYPGRRQAESEIHPVQISVRRVSRERGTAEKGKNRVPVSTGRGKIDTHPFRLDVKATENKGSTAQFPPYGLSSASALRIMRYCLRIMQYCLKNGVCVFCLAFLPKKVELVYVNAIYFVFCAEAALYTVGYTIQKDGCLL